MSSDLTRLGDRISRSFLLQELIATPLGVAHARRLLDTTGLFNGEAGPSFDEDKDMWQRLARAGATFLYLPLKSGRYHVRPDSLARTYRGPQAPAVT